MLKTFPKPKTTAAAAAAITSCISSNLAFSSSHIFTASATETFVTNTKQQKMQQPKRRPKIVTFGDSITERGYGEDDELGWVSLLSSSYSRRSDVLNRGYSGYTSRHGLDILPLVLDDVTGGGHDHKENFLFWTVFFGANDASLPGSRQHVPIDEYGENVHQMVGLIRESMNKIVKPSDSCAEDEVKQQQQQQPANIPIILITPPPVNATQWLEYCMSHFGEKRSDRSNSASRDYGTKLKEIASRHDACHVLDSHQLLGGSEEGDYGKYLKDGLHLNGLGNKILFDGLLGLVEREYPDLMPMFDGEGRYGEIGIPLEGKLWTEMC